VSASTGTWTTVYSSDVSSSAAIATQVAASPAAAGAHHSSANAAPSGSAPQRTQRRRPARRRTRPIDQGPHHRVGDRVDHAAATNTAPASSGGTRATLIR
jgi:hypothetical protein